MSKNTNVNVSFLDATKAFDRVEYIKLFRLLVKRSISPLTIRLLLNMYTSQTINVVWENTFSEPFDVSNGVKQGGVLSPILFGIYIDELMSRLKKSSFGCHIGHMFVGALAFADDLALLWLSPTITGLKRLIDICSEFGKEFNVLFNPSKINGCHSQTMIRVTQ